MGLVSFYVFMLEKGAQYNIADWQGNNVDVINRSGKIVQTTAYYPYGEPTIEPSGQRFLYGGKEREHGGGRNTYDVSARSLIAPLGQWCVPDRLSEKTPEQSIYSYCGGDPINYVDPNGMQRYFIGLDGRCITPEYAGLMGLRGEYGTEVDQDQIVILDDAGRALWASPYYDSGTVSISSIPVIIGDDEAVGQLTTIQVKGDGAAKEIFEGLANTITSENGIEFGMNLNGAYSSHPINEVFTSHTSKAVYGTELKVNSKTLRSGIRHHVHSHPNEKYPSLPDYKNMVNVIDYTQNHRLHIPQFSIYHVPTRKYRRYDKTRVCGVGIRERGCR